MTNFNTLDCRNEAEFDAIDAAITEETKRKIEVTGFTNFGIMTCAMINGQFQCVSDYEIDDERYDILFNA